MLFSFHCVVFYAIHCVLLQEGLRWDNSATASMLEILHVGNITTLTTSSGPKPPESSNEAPLPNFGFGDLGSRLLWDFRILRTVGCLDVWMLGLPFTETFAAFPNKKVSKALIAGANFSNFCPLPKGFFKASNCFLNAFILEILTYFIYH